MILKHDSTFLWCELIRQQNRKSYQFNTFSHFVSIFNWNFLRWLNFSASRIFINIFQNLLVCEKWIFKLLIFTCVFFVLLTRNLKFLIKFMLITKTSRAENIKAPSVFKSNLIDYAIDSRVKRIEDLFFFFFWRKNIPKNAKF